MTHTLLIGHYALWLALLATAAITLRAYRGVSLLSIYSVSLALQVGTLFAVAGDWGEFSLSEEATKRFGLSLMISYAILILFLIGLYLLRDRSPIKKKLQALALSRVWMFIGVLLLLAVVVVRLTSASGRMVLEHGLDSLGDEQYYGLRVELIGVHAVSTTRAMRYFECTARQILFMLLIIASSILAKKRSVVMGVYLVSLLSGLFFVGLVSLQKSPIVLVLLAGTAPLLLSTSASGWRRVVKLAVRLTVSVLVVFATGVVLYSVTQGFSPAESLSNVVNRIFVVPASVSCAHFEVYPDLRPHVQWADFRPARVLLGNESLLPLDGSISIEVSDALTGVKANANAAFVADSWAAAGYFGVVVGTLIMAVFCFVTDRFTSFTGRSVSLFPLGIYYWVGFPCFGNGSFATCVIEVALWLIPALYCLFLMPRRFRPEFRGPGYSSSVAMPGKLDGRHDDDTKDKSAHLGDPCISR